MANLARLLLALSPLLLLSVSWCECLQLTDTRATVGPGCGITTEIKREDWNGENSPCSLVTKVESGEGEPDGVASTRDTTVDISGVLYYTNCYGTSGRPPCSGNSTTRRGRKSLDEEYSSILDPGLVPMLGGVFWRRRKSPHSLPSH